MYLALAALFLPVILFIAIIITIAVNANKPPDPYIESHTGNPWVD